MNFSGAVMGNVGSVQFQIAPWSSLYLFSRSIGPLQCIVNLNYRVLICFTCHFQSGSLFFVYFGFLCLQVSSVSNFHPDTGGKSGHLFQLTCSVVSWGRRDTTNITVVCGECLQCVDHTGFATAQGSVFPRSPLLRLQGALQGHCPKWTCVSCISQV